MSQVRRLVRAVLNVLTEYPPAGANFDGRPREDWAVIPTNRKATFETQLTAAISNEVLGAEQNATLDDIYHAMLGKMREQVQADLAREAKEAEQEKKAAELLAGKTPEEREAILKALAK